MSNQHIACVQHLSCSIASARSHSLGAPKLPGFRCESFASDNCAADSEDMSIGSQFQRLPEDILVSIFRCVPVARRLNVLSRVCSKWHAAATAATDDICCNLHSIPSSVLGISDSDLSDSDDSELYPYESSPRKWQWQPKHHGGHELDMSFGTASIYPWLHAHGSHVTSLRVINGWKWLLQKLPCPNLLELELQYLSVQFEPDKGAPGILQCSTALTKLILNGCCPVDTDKDPLAQIGTLTALQHLVLQDECGQARRYGGRHVLPGTVLQQLQHLTHLTLDHETCIAQDSLQHLSCLSNLQEFKLRDSAAAGGAMRQLSCLQHLQRLQICGQPCDVFLRDVNISAVTTLTYLQLQEVNVQPVALAGLTQLLHLQLQFVFDVVDLQSAHAPSRILELLAKLQRLQVLKLEAPRFEWPTTGLEQYSALTASSDLQQLDLFECSGLPVAALQYAFGEGKQLPQLQKLTLQWPQTRPWLGDPHGWQDPDPESTPAPGSTDMAHIASACRALRELHVTAEQGTDFAPLQQLTLLHFIGAACGAGSDSFGSTIRAMSVLTHLQDLEVVSSSLASFDDVLHLTALTHLTKLNCSAAELMPTGAMDYVTLNLSKAPGVSSIRNHGGLCCA